MLELPQFTNKDSESWAVFFEGDYDLSENLMLTLGARYTEDDKTTSQQGIVPCGQDPATFPAPYSGTGQVTRVVNASDATIQGLELELAWLVADGFTVRSNLGLLDAEYDTFRVDTGTPGNPNLQDFSNLEFRRAPEVTFG